MLNSTEVASSQRMGGLRGAFLLLPEYLAMEFFLLGHLFNRWRRALAELSGNVKVRPMNDLRD